VLFQLETTELAAGNAPDLIVTFPGCGTPISMCALAKPGYLAPMVEKPWVKWSLPLVTSGTKYGQGLFGFELNVNPFVIFTNDGLFKRLGLAIPQTFSQLLDVCRKAKAAGTAAAIFGGATATSVQFLITELVIATLYGKDKQWAGALRAGKVTFAGTLGWRQALQEFIDMNNAGCFQPGATGTSATSADALFAQGQGLMLPYVTTAKGVIDAANPQFTYTAHPFPAGSTSSERTNYLHFGLSVSINAHSSPQAQAAAQTFIDFIARPKQNALFSQATGGLTQYQFLKGPLPDWMASLEPAFKQRQYVTDPTQTWWNANVLLVLQSDGIGLITGQRSIDDVLNAMDVAWKQGPA
jgi:raffinose/stachyose/melibiose transport system substrate-binding protein